MPNHLILARAVGEGVISLNTLSDKLIRLG